MSSKEISNLKRDLLKSKEALDSLKAEHAKLNEEHAALTASYTDMNVDLAKIESMCSQVLRMYQSGTINPDEALTTMIDDLIINKRRLTEIVPRLLN